MTQNRTLQAGLAILGYAILIAFTDNFVRYISDTTGLWQFHATRAVMIAPLILLMSWWMSERVRPRNPRAVLARSLVHGLAMLIYFGCLAFLSVAQTAAGLFTAPIFVLLFSRFLFGYKLGPVRILAVALGSLGVVLVLQPGSASPLGWLSLVPVLAGALYALGNLATREWCEGESATTLLAGFFMTLGIAGAVGLVLLALFPVAVPEGPDGFILRGWVTPTPGFLAVCLLQAVGSILGIRMMIRGYQLADASRVAVFEYMVLPASLIWSFLLWGERVDMLALGGMALITVAGAIIAFRSRQ